jgi:hypothetical protein
LAAGVVLGHRVAERPPVRVHSAPLMITDTAPSRCSTGWDDCPARS